MGTKSSNLYYMDITQISELQAYGGLGIAMGVATLVVTLQKVVKNFKKDREEHAAKILQEAKEEDNLLRIRLEAKITEIDAKVKNLETSVNKDIKHLQDVYSAEIKSLGEKIEVLRDELRDQHSQMVALLTKLVESKD